MFYGFMVHQGLCENRAQVSRRGTVKIEDGCDGMEV